MNCGIFFCLLVALSCGAADDVPDAVQDPVHEPLPHKDYRGTYLPSHGAPDSLARAYTAGSTYYYNSELGDQITSPPCRWNYQPTVFLPREGDYTIISTPNYPSNYEEYWKCGWTFATQANLRLRMFCPTYRFWPFDYQEVTDPARGTSWRKTFSFRSGWFYRFYGNKALVGYSADRFFNSKGFRCSVTAVVPPRSCKCGIKTPTPRIMGGNNAQRHEYPWMAYVANITNSSELLCGGVIISYQHILTAASCVQNKRISVILDQYNSSTIYFPTHVRKVSQIIIHPNYDNTTFANNIAIIKLETIISWSDYTYIRPICLAKIANTTAPTYDDKAGFITGWGTNAFGGNVSTILQELDVTVVSNVNCQTAHGSGVTVAATNICTNVTVPTKDACQKDEGGPLIIADGNNYELAGIVSPGTNCASKPRINVRVSEYLPWINNQTNPAGYCSRA